MRSLINQQQQNTPFKDCGHSVVWCKIQSMHTCIYIYIKIPEISGFSCSIVLKNQNIHVFIIYSIHCMYQYVDLHVHKITYFVKIKTKVKTA